MKKLLLLFALLLSVSTSFISCRDTAEEERVEEKADEIEEKADEVEDDY